MENKNLFTAFIKAQGELGAITKDGVNPFFKTPGSNGSKYATLQACIEELRPVLAKHDLGFIQSPTTINNEFVLVTKIIHSSGESIEAYYPLKPVKLDPQGFGSAITYAKRYALCAMFGLGTEDDDGNHANNNRQKETSAPPQQPPQPQPRPQAQSQINYQAPTRSSTPVVPNPPQTTTGSAQPRPYVKNYAPVK